MDPHMYPMSALTADEERLCSAFGKERVFPVASTLCSVMELRDPNALRPRDLAAVQAATTERWLKNRHELLLLACAALDADRLYGHVGAPEGLAAVRKP